MRNTFCPQNKREKPTVAADFPHPSQRFGSNVDDAPTVRYSNAVTTGNPVESLKIVREGDNEES